MEIEIQNYDEQPPTGNVVAVFSAYAPSAKITFHKLKLIRSKKGHSFVAMPSYMFTDSGGNKKFFPYVEMSKEVKEQFDKDVLKALEPFVANRA